MSEASAQPGYGQADGDSRDPFESLRRRISELTAADGTEAQIEHLRQQLSEQEELHQDMQRVLAARLSDGDSREVTPSASADPRIATSKGGGCAGALLPATKFDVASTISICAFGYLGVLVRLGLTAFSSWWSVEQPGTCQLLGQLGHGFFLANIVGCLLMGFAKRAAEFHCGRHALLYTGFTTGLCGCLTTFATWNQAASIQIVRGNVSDGLLMCVASTSTPACCVCIIAPFMSLTNTRLRVTQPSAPARSGAFLSAAWAASRK